MDYIDAAIIDRIDRSPLTLTIVFPPAAVIPVVASPSTAPVNPLTRPEPAPAVLTADPVGSPSDLTMNCLWIDTAVLADTPGHEMIKLKQLGWVVEATALVRVKVKDAALDLTNPYAGNWFDKALRVEHSGNRYKVLQVIPMASGSKIPVTYHVWLGGGDGRSV